ncbi:MAG: DUF697 domain-containing protein [Clostridiaceae bacterium]
MEDIKKSLLKWLILPLIGFIIFFLIIVLNQGIQLTTWAFGVNNILGYTVAALLILLFTVLILYPVIRVLSYKAVPEVPKSKEDKEFPVYVDTMHSMLKKNTYLSAHSVDLAGQNKELELENAYRALGDEADTLIKAEAVKVFLTTSISQNGALDGVFILTSLVKMIWKITHLYEARPSLRKLIYIYSNVAGTVLIARGIEDLDLIEDQIEPLITSLVGGSIMSVVPGAVPITNLLVSSVMEGAVNALLTLRCGYITTKYLGSLTIPDKKKVRRSSSLESASKIGNIISENTVHIIKSFASAAKNAAKSATTSKFGFGKKVATEINNQ